MKSSELLEVPSYSWLGNQRPLQGVSVSIPAGHRWRAELRRVEEGWVKGLDFPSDVSGKESTCHWRRLHWHLGHEHPLEEGTATHPSMLPWRIPWTEEPDGLQSIESQRVRHGCSDLACTDTVNRLLKWCNGEGNGNPLQDSWLENSMGRGAWHATVRAATKSQT